MATGDLAGNVEALRQELAHIKYPAHLNPARAKAGDPVELLPMLSFALLRFSRHVAQVAADSGYQLQGKTDQRFVEAAWQLLRDMLGIKTVLTPAQFLSEGFAERKVLLVRQVVKACKDLHNSAARKKRLAALKGTHSEQRQYACSEHGSGGVLPAPPMGKLRQPPVKVVNALLDQAGNGPECGWEQEGAGECCPSGEFAADVGCGGSSLAISIQPPLEAQPAAEPPCERQPALSSAAAAEAEQPRALPPSLLLQQQQQQQQHGLQIPRHRGWHDTGQAEAAGQAPPSTAAATNVGMQWQPPAHLGGYMALPPRIDKGQSAQLAIGVPLAAPSLAAAAYVAQQLNQQHTKTPVAAAAASASPYPAWHAVPVTPQPQQQQAELPPQPIQQASAAWQQLPAQQLDAGCMQALVSHQPLPPQQQQLGTADPSARRLIEDLQLRLQLAEETALETRHAAERVQESLQARIAVLEGRVKFLEHGFGLQPLGPQLLQLPWASPPKSPSHPQLQRSLAAAAPAGFGVHWPLQAQQQHQSSSSAAGTSQPDGATAAAVPSQPGGVTSAWAAAPPALPAPPQQPAPALDWLHAPVSLQRCPLPLAAHPGASPADGGAAPGGAGQQQYKESGNRGGGCSSGKAAGLAVQCSFSSTSELVRSMQGRFSEADEFLRILQQRH